MHPTIALLLCILFISIVLIIDFKQRPNVATALWVPFIWMMYCGSKGLSRWLNLSPEYTVTAFDYTKGSPIDRTFLAILIVIGLIILYKRRIAWSEIFKRNVWILILFLYMAVSILWSDLPGLSFKRWIRTVGDLIMVLIIMTDDNPLESIKVMFRRSAFVLLPLSILFITYFRHIGVIYSANGLMEMWVGVTTHKNDLGYLVMAYGIYFLWNILINRNSEKKYVDVLFLIMAIFLLMGSPTSSSKTSILIFILGTCILIYAYLFKSYMKYIGRIILVIFIFFFFLNYSSIIFFHSSLLEKVATSSGRDITLTGRTQIWKEIFDIASSSCFFGKGYRSFWIGEVTLSNDSGEQFVPIKQSHNGYIDIYLELGLLGLFIFLCLVISEYRNIRRTLMIDFEYGIMRMTFFFMILLHNLSESSFARPNHFLWFIFLLVIFNTWHRHDSVKTI